MTVCALGASACSVLDGDSTEELQSDSGANEQRGSAATGSQSGGERTEGGEGQQDAPGSGDATDDDGDEPATPGDSENPPFEPSITEEELAARLSDLGGRLAIGIGPEVAVVRPDGLNVEVLDGTDSVFASQPTWSHDGTRLAWSSVSAESQVLRIQTFDNEGARVGEPERSDAEGSPVFYLQWNESDDTLAYIRNAPSGGVVEVGLVEPGSPVEPVGVGAPFFVAWSPAPDRVLGHVNEESIDLLDVKSTGSPAFDSVLDDGGGFSAPSWVDGRRALVVIDGALSYLDVGNGEVEPIEPVDGPVRFVLSPDKTKVAYQLVGGTDGLAVIGLPVQDDRSGLTVLELATGTRTTVTGDLALAWEWSPDSDKLAWLSFNPSAGRPTVQWRFWAESGPLPTGASSEFVPTRKYGQAYLPFFAQYTQSVTGWSPDSDAFAFAGTADGDRGVWIQLIDEVVAPELVTDGDFVTWGPGPTPPAGGNIASAA